MDGFMLLRFFATMNCDDFRGHVFRSLKNVELMEVTELWGSELVFYNNALQL